MCLKSIAHKNLIHIQNFKRKVIIIIPLLRVKGHLNVVLGHFCNISYTYLQNIDQICDAIFDILCGIIEKVELSNTLLHVGV